MSYSKKIPAAITAIIVIAMLIVTFFYMFQIDSKQVILQYVLKNHIELEKYANTLVRESNSDTTAEYNNWDVYYWHASNLVEFVVDKTGLVTNSKYSGFYYSPSDMPLGFQGNAVVFCEHGSGWIWTEKSGDNREYTERIRKNWFWFEMHF